MTISRRVIFQTLVALLAVLLVGGVTWMSGLTRPASAQEPDEPTLEMQILTDGEVMRLASSGPIPTFEVGDTFKVSIIAQAVSDPGLFGSQFELTYDTQYLEAIEGSLIPGTALQPVVNPVNTIDPDAGLAAFAASRQGDLDNLLGNVVLATLRFEAIAPTEPPEGQATTLHLQNVKLGAKGGIEIEVGGLVDLQVIIRGDGSTQPGPGDIIGRATVEGRAEDNQAGHNVTAVGDLGGTLSATTTISGSFWINNAPADTYTVTASRPGFLAATCTGVVHNFDVLTSLSPVQLLAGDLNDDDVIDITDAVAIGAVFGSATPGEVADLNADGVVDILDLILMAVNYGQTAAANPWSCQLPTEL